MTKRKKIYTFKKFYGYIGNIVNVKNRGLGVTETRFKARLTLNRLLLLNNLEFPFW